MRILLGVLSLLLLAASLTATAYLHGPAASGFHPIETLYQLNFDDMAHEKDSWSERLKAVVPYIMKRVFPSTRNGIIMAARNP